MNNNGTAADESAAYADELVLLRKEAVERIGDEEIYREIAHYFAEHLEGSLNELTNALADGDTGTAARLVHSMKGNCATVGADVMRGQCLILEKLCCSGNLEEARSHYADLRPKMLALRDLLACV